MELRFIPLPAFLALLGKPLILWPSWQEFFQTFITAIRLANAARLKAMLIHSLGTEGQRIFRTL